VVEWQIAAARPPEDAYPLRILALDSALLFTPRYIWRGRGRGNGDGDRNKKGGRDGVE